MEHMKDKKDTKGMEYTERHHAFISATFYKKLKSSHKEKGLEVFVIATQRYAEQRGSRMAQRAIMLDMPLTFETYSALGEWEYSESFSNSVKERGMNRHIETLSLSPDLTYDVLACPWHDQYKAMGLLDGALLYCEHLDLAISRGFNPYLDFRVLQTLHNTDKCVFVLKDANLKEPAKKLKEYQLPFEYHCAHIYWTFSAISKSILKSEGSAISTSVLSDFAKEYNKNAADRLLSYKHMDFNVLPD